MRLPVLSLERPSVNRKPIFFVSATRVSRVFRRRGLAAAGRFAVGGGGAVEDTAMFELVGYLEIFRQAGLREHPRGIPADRPGCVLFEQVILIQEEAFFASRAIAEVGGVLAEILAAPVKRRIEFEPAQCHGVKTVWCSADVLLDEAAGYAARVSEPGGGDCIEKVVFVERAAETLDGAAPDLLVGKKWIYHSATIFDYPMPE